MLSSLHFSGKYCRYPPEIHTSPHLLSQGLTGDEAIEMRDLIQKLLGRCMQKKELNKNEQT